MKRLTARLCAAAALAYAPVAVAAQSYPQVVGPGGSSLPPQAVAVTGVLSDGATPCVLPSAGCQPAASAASNVAPVAGAFSAAGPSASFTPIAGRPFNISIQGAFVGSVQLERYLGGAWQPLTVSAAGSIIQVYLYTAPASESVTESQAGVPYRLNCTSYTSGSISYSLSQ